MNEDLVSSVTRLVVLFHNVVDVRHSRADEQREDEGYYTCESEFQSGPDAPCVNERTSNVVSGGPEVDVDGIKNSKKRETP